MRLASALASSLLVLAASAALADPPPPGQGATAPRGQPASRGAVEAADHGKADAAGLPAPGQPSPGVGRAAYPAPDSGAESDRRTEANCYIVFGDLRCDRIAAHRPK